MNTSTSFQETAVRWGFVKYRSLFLTFILLVVLSSPLWFKGQLILFLATQAAVMMLVAIGLNLLMGYAGLVSLGHGALVAIGGYTTALLMVDAQISFWIASLAGVALATVTGVLMALPALRLSTWYFALVTLTFSQVVSDLLVEWKGVTKGFSGIVGIPAPSLFGRSLSPVEVYIVVAACVVLAFILSRNLVQSRIGRGMVAARDNPLAATAAGVSIWRIKLFAFAISAALAGLAGAFFAVQKTVITPEDFNADFSIFFLLTIVVGGLGRLWGPVIGTLVFFLLPELLGPLQSWRLLIYGVILLVLMVFAPHGITGMKWWRRWFDRPASITVLDGEKRPVHADPIQHVSLMIRGLKKHFGGVKALDGCDLHADSACVHALVGPNGSGKTTILNAISGFVQADEGSIIIGSVNVMKMAPHQIARLGVGRTFQTPKLLNDMTVLDNVQLGGFVSEKASAFEIALRLARASRDQAEGQTNAMELLLFVGLAERANDIAGDLPHGQQRLVEIARAMVSRPSLLLLDEPAAGLSLAELDRLGILIEAIVAKGTTVLVVEHHLELIARISRSVTVLDRGCVLADGTPDEVFSHPEVERAYMGREAMRGAK